MKGKTFKAIGLNNCLKYLIFVKKEQKSLQFANFLHIISLLSHVCLVTLLLSESRLKLYFDHLQLLTFSFPKVK